MASTNPVSTLCRMISFSSTLPVTKNMRSPTNLYTTTTLSKVMISAAGGESEGVLSANPLPAGKPQQNVLNRADQHHSAPSPRAFVRDVLAKRDFS